VVFERLPNGTVRKTTITTTTREAEAPDPSPRAADPYPADPLVRYNVEALNRYRSKAGAAPLLYDAKISAFALEGSKQLAQDHEPHAHFASHAKSSANGFGTRSAENQGDPSGVPPMEGKKQVDIMIDLMFQEGPGGGHHDNMVNPRYRRVGVGLYVTAEGRMYLTNDFSN
jgi:uncharacterized protein YkwD